MALRGGAYCSLGSGGGTVYGGDGDDDDTLSLDTAAGAVTVNLQSSTITGYGGTIHFQDLQAVNANASSRVTSRV